MTHPREESFDERYPHPQIHRSWAAPIGQFKIIEVFDSSQLIEDPIGTSLWIELPDGRKRSFSAEALASIAREQRIAPSTEEEAWAFATLPVLCTSHLSRAAIWEPGPSQREVPPKTLERLTPPSTVRVEGGWDVGFTSVVEGHYHRAIARWRVTFRGSDIRFAAEEIWPRDSAAP